MQVNSFLFDDGTRFAMTARLSVGQSWRRYVLEACRGLEGTLEGGQSLFSCAEAPRAHTQASVMNRFEPTSSRMGSRPGEANVATHITALL